MITDDAGVVGKNTAQVETWLRFDRDTALHLASVAYGPVEPLEVSLSAVHGTRLEDPEYAAAGPILQLKLLVFAPVPAGAPGLALAAGTVPPFGFGGLEPDDWSGYGYAALTEVPSSTEWLRLHANLGAVVAGIDSGAEASPTFGLCGVANLIGGLDLFAEIVSGDPTTEELDGVAHGGLKFSFAPNFHVDATLGAGIWGAELLAPFATLGARWASQ